ncbi:MULTISPECIES: NADPH-dependent FMN reductase [unclassified Streptomyces]|uniref:NADPH-dependent FMN reductase n=1 Tax=unclassified Streptomyces TaxID=2593676 RepID=UPI000DB9BEA1|nr:NADPH-dependent FMN reductase [Streptomyces sp. PsTaAH-137]MYT75671.1 NADPH-dependent FMN reductase [Streptomyces sp. SID8367]RAJ87079.1 SsuE family FMN reductase [Streptomyces sp. PsTaAH-137]
MALLLTLTGSASAPGTSRTAHLVRDLGAELAAHQHEIRHLDVRSLPAEGLLSADTADPGIAAAVGLVARADALIVASPVYKAAYSGVLKTFLDLLPQYALRGKPVLPLATGGSPAHVLAVDYALRPVLTSLGADVAQGWFVLDRHISVDADGGVTLTSETREALAPVLDRFRDALPTGSRLAAA